MRERTRIWRRHTRTQTHTHYGWAGNWSIYLWIIQFRCVCVCECVFGDEVALVPICSREDANSYKRSYGFSLSFCIIAARRLWRLEILCVTEIVEIEILCVLCCDIVREYLTNICMLYNRNMTAQTSTLKSISYCVCVCVCVVKCVCVEWQPLPVDICRVNNSSV